MDCLINAIGIRKLVQELKTEPSTTGLYLEDLEGMTLKSVANIEPGKEQSGAALFNSIVLRAGNLMVEDIRTHLMGYLRDSGNVEFGGFGEFKEDHKIVPVVMTGIKVELRGSHFMELVCTSIYIKSFSAVPGTQVLLSDGNGLSKTYEIDTTNRVIEIPTQFISRTGLIELQWITNGQTVYETQLKNTMLFSGCHGCNSGYQFLKAAGMVDDVENLSYTYGLSMDVQAVCNMEKIICFVLQRFKNALLYKVGIETLKEHVSTDRLNFLAIHRREWAEEKIAEWQEVNYPNYLDNGMNGLAHYLQRIDSNCFNCGGISNANLHP